MIIKVLVENTVISDNFEAEHGLSLYIETEKHKMLFDLGQTNLFLKNAKKLGVKIEEIDTVVISHAHYDHTGGLKYFVQKNSTANIFINENVKGDFYSGEKYIGIDKSIFESDRLIFTKDFYEIDDELMLFTANREERKFESYSHLLKKCDGKMVEDDYQHEQYLLIRGEDNILISGCSHKGIMNIVDFAKPYDVKTIVGGFHLKELDEDPNMVSILSSLAKLLKSTNSNFLTCHCTGVPQYQFLKKTMKNRLNYISTGQIIEI